MNTCEQCGQKFQAKRSDARTCGDACRAKKSRRARDPEIGSTERKQNQREGLNQKYIYRQVRKDLQRLGLVPSSREFGSQDSFGFADRYPGASRTDLVPARSKGSFAPKVAGRWNQGADGWNLHEPMLAFGRPLQSKRLGKNRWVISGYLLTRHDKDTGVSSPRLTGIRYRKVKIAAGDPHFRPNLDKCDATYSMRKKNMSNVIPLPNSTPTLAHLLRAMRADAAETRRISEATFDLTRKIAETLDLSPDSAEVKDAVTIFLKDASG